MNRTILSFILLAGALFSSSALAQVPGACSHKFLSDQEIEYKFKGREIQLVGWNHHIQNDLLSALKAMQDAVYKSQAGDCKEAEKILQDYVKQSAVRLKESNGVIASLDSAYGKKQFTTIGIEHTPEEWQENFDPESKGHRIEMILANISRPCSNVNSVSGDVLRIFDPVYYFVEKVNGKKVKIEPLEDAEQKKASLKGVSGDTLNFELSAYPHISAVAKVKVQQVQSKIKMGFPPSDEDIREIAAAETAPAMKAKLTQVFTELKQVMSFIDARNKTIAEKIAKTQSNYALVIGGAHLKGIVAELDKACAK